MNDLKTVKVTFRLKGSNNKKLLDIIKQFEDKHDVTITKTDLLNTAVDVFFNQLEAEDKSVKDYLIEYNKLWRRMCKLLWLKNIHLTNT